MKDFLINNRSEIIKISCLALGLIGISIGILLEVPVLTTLSAVLGVVAIGALFIDYFVEASKK